MGEWQRGKGVVLQRCPGVDTVRPGQGQLYRAGWDLIPFLKDLDVVVHGEVFGVHPDLFKYYSKIL